MAVERQAWFKSPVTAMKAPGCSVWCPAVTVWMTSHAASAFRENVEWGIVKSSGDNVGIFLWRKPRARSLMSGIQTRPFTVMCPGWRHLLFTKEGNPFSFLLTLRCGVSVRSDCVEAGESHGGVLHHIVSPRLHKTHDTGLSLLTLAPGERFQFVRHIFEGSRSTNDDCRDPGLEPPRLHPDFSPPPAATASPPNYPGEARLFSGSESRLRAISWSRV